MVAGLPTQMHNGLGHPLGTLIRRQKKNTRQKLAMPPPVLSQAHWFQTSLQRLVLNHHDLCPGARGPGSRRQGLQLPASQLGQYWRGPEKPGLHLPGKSPTRLSQIPEVLSMLEVAQPRGSRRCFTPRSLSVLGTCVYAEPEHRFGTWRYTDELLCHLTS